jgi:hypothetical protein
MICKKKMEQAAHLEHFGEAGVGLGGVIGIALPALETGPRGGFRRGGRFPLEGKLG